MRLLRSLRAAGPVLLAAAAPLAAAPGQSVTVSGRVLRGDQTPLARQWAVLHRIGALDAGPVDSVRTDAAGRYVMTVAAVEPDADYFMSAEYHGIGYFSARIPLDRGPRADVPPLVVHDTSSSGPAIVLQRRLITMGRPGADGSREVLELLELLNPGTATRVSPDGLRPVWSGVLPREAVQFQSGESDMSPGSITRLGERVGVFAPLPPAQVHQVTFQYFLPADVRTLRLPIDQPVAELNVLLEDTAAVLSGLALEAVGVQPIENRRFAGFRAGAVAGDTSVTIAFPAPPFRLDRLVPWIAGMTGLALALGLWRATRRET